MLDLNELKEAVDNNKVNREAVRVVMRDGKIVDYLTNDDVPRGGEVIKMMPLMEVLDEVFSTM